MNQTDYTHSTPIRLFLVERISTNKAKLATLTEAMAEVSRDLADSERALAALDASDPEVKK